MLRRVGHDLIQKLIETYEDENFVFLVFESYFGVDLSNKLSIVE